MAVSGTSEMIAGMDPVHQPGAWMFCTLPAADARAAELIAVAWSVVREAEGVSLILPVAAAEAVDLPGEGPMAWIQLNVFSALEGVGLTAAVSAVLAEAGLPCNIVAGFHHDHVFVPLAQAERAVALLRARAQAEHVA